jgi:hypothetical protein
MASTGDNIAAQYCPNVKESLFDDINAIKK